MFWHIAYDLLVTLWNRYEEIRENYYAFNSNNPDSLAYENGMTNFHIILDYSPFSCSFDWNYNANMEIEKIIIGTLTNDGENYKVTLLLKIFEIKEDFINDRGMPIRTFEANTIAKIGDIGEHNLTSIFEVRISKQGTILLRGSLNKRDPENHAILAFDESLHLTAIHFYRNFAVPDYDPFENAFYIANIIQNEYKVEILSASNFQVTAQVSLGIRRIEAEERQFCSLQAKAGKSLYIVLQAIYTMTIPSVSYCIKVFSKTDNTLLCTKDFLEAGFSSFRFLVDKEDILFLTLSNQIQRYRVENSELKKQSITQLYNLIRSSAHSLWLHKDMEHNNFVLECWNIERSASRERGGSRGVIGMMCSPIKNYTRNRKWPDWKLRELIDICAADDTKNTISVYDNDTHVAN